MDETDPRAQRDETDQGYTQRAMASPSLRARYKQETDRKRGTQETDRKRLRPDDQPGVMRCQPGSTDPFLDAALVEYLHRARIDPA